MKPIPSLRSEPRRGWPRYEVKPKPTPNPSGGGERRAAVAPLANHPWAGRTRSAEFPSWEGLGVGLALPGRQS